MDEYPNDPTKWKKETEKPEPEQPEEKKPEKREEFDPTMSIVVATISITGAIIFILIIYLIIRPRKPGKGKEVDVEKEQLQQLSEIQPQRPQNHTTQNQSRPESQSIQIPHQTREDFKPPLN